MKRFQLLLLNVLLPLAAGAIFYLPALRTGLPAIVVNHLADGLWAYAFTFSFFIIWQAWPPLLWMVILFAVPAGFEWLQYLGIVAGTADIADVVVYYSFMTVACIIFYFTKKQTLHYETAG